MAKKWYRNPLSGIDEKLQNRLGLESANETRIALPFKSCSQYQMIRFWWLNTKLKMVSKRTRSAQLYINTQQFIYDTHIFID